MSARPGAVDAPELTRARRRIAVLVSAAVLAGVLLASAVTWVTVIRTRDASTRVALAQAVATSDDVTDPPAGVWLFQRSTDGSLAATPGAPAALPDRAAIDRVLAGEATVVVEVRVAGREFLTSTQRRGRSVVQAAADLGAVESERHALAAGLAVASAVGLVVALVVGQLLARRATAPLAEALVRQRRFVADASHELRTPLTRLALRAQLMERALRPGGVRDRSAATDAGVRQLAKGEDAHADAARLVADARDLGEVLEDLLLSAQLGHHPAGGSPVHLAPLVAEVVAADDQRAAAAGIGLVADVRDVPAVTGHPAALRRAVAALVDNALAHTPDGGTITVRVAPGAADTARLEVEDGGSGVDPADLDRLVQPFTRGADDHRRFGLGLALVRDVVTAHGGRLTVSSPPGRGACFSVELPTAAPASPRVPTASRSRR